MNGSFLPKTSQHE